MTVNDIKRRFSGNYKRRLHERLKQRSQAALSFYE